MDIRTTSLSYNFDSEGNTTSVTVSLGGQDSSDFISANTTVTTEDLTKDQTFDDLTKKDITTIAREKLAESTAVSAPNA